MLKRIYALCAWNTSNLKAKRRLGLVFDLYSVSPQSLHFRSSIHLSTLWLWWWLKPPVHAHSDTHTVFKFWSWWTFAHFIQFHYMHAHAHTHTIMLNKKLSKSSFCYFTIVDMKMLQLTPGYVTTNLDYGMNGHISFLETIPCVFCLCWKDKQLCHLKSDTYN